MIEYAARKLSLGIKHFVPEANVNILSYEIGRQLNFYSIIVLTAGIGALTGHFLDSMLAMIGCAALRKLSGGRHLSLTPCTIFSVLLFTTAPLLSMSREIVILLTCLTILGLLLYSKRQTSQKIASILLVLTNFLILSPVLTIVYIVQTASIIEKRGGAE